MVIVELQNRSTWHIEEKEQKFTEMSARFKAFTCSAEPGPLTSSLPFPWIIEKVCRQMHFYVSRKKEKCTSIGHAKELIIFQKTW